MRNKPQSGKVGHIQLEASESERRDQFIAAALTGLLAKGFNARDVPSELAKKAIAVADEVIKQAPREPDTRTSADEN